MLDPQALLKSANQGNQEDYGRLLQWLQEHAVSQIKMNLRKYYNFPAQSVDDVVQDILITFHNTHQTFDTSRPFIPWINAVIKYRTIDFLRKKEFRMTMSAVDLEMIKELWPENETEELDSDELHKLIETLPADQKSVLIMAKVDGFSGKEIAQKLSLSQSNVKVIVFRAIKQLKKLASASRPKD